MFIFRNIRCTECQESLLKSGNKTANIHVKKLQFIDTVNGDGSQTAKNHKKALLTTLTLTFRRC